MREKRAMRMQQQPMYVHNGCERPEERGRGRLEKEKLHSMAGFAMYGLRSLP